MNWQPLRRLLFRAPIAVFRSGFGWLFAGRLALVEHTGRRSGAARFVVLEIVEQDPRTGAVIVASGFGPAADWYRNLLSCPRGRMRIGRRWVPVNAQKLPADQAIAVMARYADRHPRLVRRMAGLLRLPAAPGTPAHAAIGSGIPFLILTPIATRR
jgi:deazaflavin-dependent oxidoreductase (nitroreductase family)